MSDQTLPGDDQVGELGGELVPVLAPRTRAPPTLEDLPLLH
jgi:hypothetical protein